MNAACLTKSVEPDIAPASEKMSPPAPVPKSNQTPLFGLTWNDGFTLRSVWSVKPETFAVPSSGLVAETVEEVNQRDVSDFVNVHRRIFLFG